LAALATCSKPATPASFPVSDPKGAVTVTTPHCLPPHWSPYGFRHCPGTPFTARLLFGPHFLSFCGQSALLCDSKNFSNTPSLCLFPLGSPWPAVPDIWWRLAGIEPPWRRHPPSVGGLLPDNPATNPACCASPDIR